MSVRADIVDFARGLLKQITRGKWRIGRGMGRYCIVAEVGKVGRKVAWLDHYEFISPSDEIMLTEAPSIISDLLDEIDSLRSEVDRLKAGELMEACHP